MDQLKYLIQFQAIENKKKALNLDYEEIPKRKVKLQKDFQAFENECLMKKAELEHLRKQHRELEKQVTLLEDKFRRARQKESEVKTNKEYKALLSEQEEIKREIAEKEDLILEGMENIEALQKELTQSEKELTIRRAALEKELEALEQESMIIMKKIGQLASAQDDIKSKLDVQLRKRCEFLMVKQGGIAVAPVNNGVCKVCHVSLPPQKFIELQKGESLMHCPHCHRFIYWPQSEAYSEVEKEISSFLEACGS